MAVYLVDTCIWRDFYEARISKSGNPIGKYAHDFFNRVILGNETIIYSDWLIRELIIGYSMDEINEMLNMFISLGILLRINTDEKEIIEAERLSIDRSVPFVDCLNAVQARNRNAMLITRDKHYFTDLNDITKAITPESID